MTPSMNPKSFFVVFPAGATDVCLQTAARKLKAAFNVLWDCGIGRHRHYDGRLYLYPIHVRITDSSVISETQFREIIFNTFPEWATLRYVIEGGGRSGRGAVPTCDTTSAALRAWSSLCLEPAGAITIISWSY